MKIEWIPVEERLPEVSGEYLVFIKYTTPILQGRGCEDSLAYSAKHKTFNGFDSMDDETASRVAVTNVTHWAELPEPPEGWTL